VFFAGALTLVFLLFEAAVLLMGVSLFFDKVNLI
jgi:hypothetical protein